MTSVVSIRTRVTVVAALCALVATLLALPAAPAEAQDASDQQAAASAAAAWLVDQHAEGRVTSPGGMADVIFALSGAGLHGDTVATIRAELEAAVVAYLDEVETPDEGQAAKAMLGLRASGGDYTDVGGTDLEAELRALMATDGGDAGRFADATVFTQSLALQALATTAGGVPEAAATWLADRRCPDGGWENGLTEMAGVSMPCQTPAGGDIDTTAMAVQGLLDIEPTADERDAAATWLADQQADDGSFGGNANSTGLAAQTLRALDLTDAADAAAEFVITLQKPAEDPEAGAIAYTVDDDGSLLLATTQGILALGAPAFPSIAAPAIEEPVSGACTDAEGVTVTVDLTFFDGGEVLTGCAPGDPASGLDALREAAFDITTSSSDFGEFVCAIEGLPELACEQPFEGQYWAYFSGNADGSWTGYQVGADTSDPAPGDVEGWVYSDGSAPSVAAATDGTLTRVAEAGRIETAIAVSRATVADGAATGLVVARADSFADALAGTPLAVAVGGPLLISGADALADAVAEEIQRVLPAESTVHVLGGTAALGDDVVAGIEALGYTVERVSGADRITTATAVADAVVAVRGTEPTDILLTTAFDFADALAAGTAAAATGEGVVLLTPSGAPHDAVDAWLEAHADATVHAVGGPAATAYPDANPIVGATREGTAVAVAEAFFDGPTSVGIARRDDFADALAGGRHAAGLGAPLLITPTDGLSADVAAYLCGTDSVEQAFVYGGEAAVSAGVANAVADAITGEGCA